MIYTRSNYFYKDDYVEKYRYFILNDYLEKKYNFERIIFQRQKNNNLGIVIHTKDIELKKLENDNLQEIFYKGSDKKGKF